jgi:hypothetical protein
VELAGELESIPRTTHLSLRGVVSLPVVLHP